MGNDKPYLMEEWWTESEIELVKDHSRIWKKERFKSVPGYWFQKNGNWILGKMTNNEELPPNAIIDKTAWDHEHCELCMKKISELESTAQEGYTDGKDWLCLECYNKYIAPHREN